MPNIDETRNANADDGRSASDEFAMQLATVVFEWRPTRISSAPPAPSELWMSRSARRSEPTPS